MISPDEQTFLWAEAYIAALSGLLARKMDDCTHFKANNVHVLTDQCKAFADQALSDALKLKTSSSSGNGEKRQAPLIPIFHLFVSAFVSWLVVSPAAIAYRLRYGLTLVAGAEAPQYF